MNGSKTKRHRFMIALQRWPKRDCCQSIGGFQWHFKLNNAFCGNLIVTRDEWQKEHWNELELA